MLHSTNILTDHLNSHSKALVLPFKINEQARRDEANVRLNNLSVQNCLSQNTVSITNAKRSPSNTNLISVQLDLRGSNSKNITNENNTTSVPLFDPTINNTPNNLTGAGSFYTKAPLIVMDPLELQQAISHDQNCLIQYQQYQQQMQHQSFPLVGHYHNQTQLYGVTPTEEDELAAAAAATWNNNFAAMQWITAATYNGVTNNSTNGINISLSAEQNSAVQQQNQILQNSTTQNTISRSLLARYSGRNSIFNLDQQPTTLSSEISLIPLNLASTSNEVDINATNETIKSNPDNVSYRNL